MWVVGMYICSSFVNEWRSDTVGEIVHMYGMKRGFGEGGGGGGGG